MKSVLLVGCGAEIGSSFIGMNQPDNDGFRVGAILTNPIEENSIHQHLKPIDSILARIVMADPSLLDAVTLNYAEGKINIKGQEIPVYFGNCTDYDLSKFGTRFDATVLATSKKHIENKKIIGRFSEISDFVVGVSESKQIPALYPNLTGLPSEIFGRAPKPIGESNIFSIGSCQSNGWHGVLRGLLSSKERLNLESLEILRMEVDIIHPDTPTGRLGTKSVEARSQDPRDNLRPSFSQVPISMNLLFPNSINSNTISLRVLTQPPGYQINRFYFSYRGLNGSRISGDSLRVAFREEASKFPDYLRMEKIPLGSRGFERCESGAVILDSNYFFLFYDDPFRLGERAVSQLVVQSYVHNVRGYCRGLINALKVLFSGQQNYAFYHQSQ